MELDEIDLKILWQLQENSNLTTKELASKVNLSSTPVFERVKRLEKEGIIQKYSALIDLEKLGGYFPVFCNIRLTQHNKNNGLAFLEAINSIPEVTECYNISGDFDFMIKLYVRTMKEYQEFVINKLGVLDFISHHHTTFVLGTLKNKGFVPMK